MASVESSNIYIYIYVSLTWYGYHAGATVGQRLQDFAGITAVGQVEPLVDKLWERMILEVLNSQVPTAGT